MAKKAVAAIIIIHDGVQYGVGEPLDPQKFTKDQLTRLYERGAIKIEDSSAEEKPEPTLSDVTNNGGDGENPETKNE